MPKKIRVTKATLDALHILSREGLLTTAAYLVELEKARYSTRAARSQLARMTRRKLVKRDVKGRYAITTKGRELLSGENIPPKKKGKARGLAPESLLLLHALPTQPSAEFTVPWLYGKMCGLRGKEYTSHAMTSTLVRFTHAGYLQRVRKGVYKLTDRGRELLVESKVQAEVEKAEEDIYSTVRLETLYLLDLQEDSVTIRRAETLAGKDGMSTVGNRRYPYFRVLGSAAMQARAVLDEKIRQLELRMERLRAQREAFAGPQCPVLITIPRED